MKLYNILCYDLDYDYVSAQATYSFSSLIEAEKCKADLSSVYSYCEIQEIVLNEYPKPYTIYRSGLNYITGEITTHQYKSYVLPVSTDNFISYNDIFNSTVYFDSFGKYESIGMCNEFYQKLKELYVPLKHYSYKNCLTLIKKSIVDENNCYITEMYGTGKIKVDGNTGKYIELEPKKIYKEDWCTKTPIKASGMPSEEKWLYFKPLPGSG